jgi:hypothetical protein
MESLSNQLHGTTGPNPFHEAQAKTFGDDKLIREFFPTSTYLSLFNEGHEVLLGSRGSGKTAILRMASYSCFNQITQPAVKKIADQRRFYGFYIPLHLEFMASLPQDTPDGSGSTEFFQFAFNCAAAKAFLAEVRTLLSSVGRTTAQRLEKEAILLERLCKMWMLGASAQFACLEDVADRVDTMYFQQAPWKDRTMAPLPIFARHLFSPIIAILPQFCRELDIDANASHWLACVDEAEFLKPAYLKCFNSFMRSEKRPIVLKLATLPYKYTSMETFVPGVSVEGSGNDFNFRSIDLAWDSEDFRLLSDHLLDKRLQRTELFSGKVNLESFVGMIGNDDPKDYYKAEVGEEIATDEKILEGILKEVSPERRARFERIRDTPARIASDYFKKFSPVFYLRYVRREAERGNRKVGIFAGPTIIRRVADGNPRRFIQMMHDMFETARRTKLGRKAQHEVIESFVDRECERAAGLPDFGLLLDGILKTVGQLMESRVHGSGQMVESGVNFEVQEALLANSVIRGALELGVAYSFLFVDTKSLTAGLTSATDFRLAHVVAVKYWLPTRSGSPVTLQSRHGKDLIRNRLLSKAPVTMKECDTALGVLQLDFFENIQSQPDHEV